MATILFFDDQRLNLWHNVVRKIGKPELIAESVYRDPDTNTAWGYPGVFYDQESDKWRLIYQGHLPSRQAIPLLAESEDGLHWTPRDTTEELDLAERMASHQLLPLERFGEWPACYVDPRAEPAERIKGLVVHRPRPFHVSTALWTSPNGLHWHLKEGVQWQKHGPDPGIGAFWNDVRQSYVLTTRPDWTDRRIAVFETQDWRHFTEPELALQADALDAPLTEPYGMPVFPYEGYYVGFLWLFHPVPYIAAHSPYRFWDGYGSPATSRTAEHSPHKFWDGPVDCQLAYSLNGWHFQRTLREPFIPTGESGSPDAGCVYPSSMIQREDGSILIYASACTHEHGYIPPGSGSIVVYRLRRDGFVHLESRSGIGTIGTRGLYWRGGDLELNVEGQGGAIRVQVTDAGGAPLEGFTFGECVPFSGDSTTWQPRWHSGRRMVAQSGNIVRVEVALRNSRIYAIRGDFLPLVGGECWRYEEENETPAPRPGF